MKHTHPREDLVHKMSVHSLEKHRFPTEPKPSRDKNNDVGELSL